MTISNTQFCFPNQKSVYHGKVRDVYDLGDTLLMVATDRISAFDHILPRAIPFKGQVLTQIAEYYLKETKDVCPNWLIATPDPNVSLGIKCEPYKVEMVIRGYLTGHAWRTYQSGERVLCGIELPEGMVENQPFDQPIITPTTKASEGHDEDISRENIINQNIVSESEYIQIENYTRALFQKGTEMAAERGLILVDTKYEFGKTNEGQIILIDEIHTPDSSRYFYQEGFEKCVADGVAPQALSKEFVRQWLISKGFQGIEGQVMPDMSDQYVQEVSEKYIQLFELITGKTFEKGSTEDIKIRIENNVQLYLGKN